MFWRVSIAGPLIGILLISIVTFRDYDRASVGTAEEIIHQEHDYSGDASTRSADMDRSKANHERLLADLKLAHKKVRAMNGYQSRFIRQVQKDGELLEPETMDLTLRHQPFSVSLHWPSTGKQVLYVEGQNDNKLLVKLSDGLLGLAGSLAIEPDGEKAMQESRYPITEIGLSKLIDRLLQAHEDVDVKSALFERTEKVVAGSECVCYTIRICSPDVSPEYSITELWICRDSGLPIRISNYGWKDSQPGQLLEHYEYGDVKPVMRFNESDFGVDDEA